MILFIHLSVIHNFIISHLSRVHPSFTQKIIEITFFCANFEFCETENNLWGNVSKQTLVPMRFVLAQTGALYVIVSYYTIPKFVSCPQQLNRWPWHSLTESLTQWLLILTLQSDPRDLWPLRHLIRVMRKHDLTNILTIFWQFWQLFTCFDNFQQFWQF